MSMCHATKLRGERLSKSCRFLSRVQGQMPRCSTTVQDLWGCESGST